jgi:3-(3-hydroxy-phenyl)propionate hydroxylase
MAEPKRVIIAGGGPVGLIVGLVLGRAGVKVTLFDQGDIVHQHPRAATIHPATLDILDDLGIYALIDPLGIRCPIVNYYDQKELLASFDHALLKDETRHPWVLQCEQDKVSRVLFSMAESVPDFEIRTETKVIDCAQDAGGVEVLVETPDGKQERHRGLYLVGADGAGSMVRKKVNVAFEGFTYPERFMIAGTPYDFEQNGYALRNYIFDPEEWYNLFKISWKGPPGVFRLVAPIRPDEEVEGEGAIRTAQRKLQRFCPRDQPYEVVIFDAYVVSQRVAATFRVGRVLLVGDSAHLNSPIGAMGMNSGIHDAFNLAGKLIAILRGEAGQEVLDRYERQRRHVAIQHTQAQTVRNKRLLAERDPAVRQRNHDELRRTAENPELARKFLLRSSLIESLREAEQIQ